MSFSERSYQLGTTPTGHGEAAVQAPVVRCFPHEGVVLVLAWTQRVAAHGRGIMIGAFGKASKPCRSFPLENI